jgi:hypothetical protein
MVLAPTGKGPEDEAVEEGFSFDCSFVHWQKGRG